MTKSKSMTTNSPSKRVLAIDIETYSDVSLKDCGVYRYAEDPSFEILLLSASYDGGPVETYQLAAGDALPDSLLSDLTDPEVIKEAHNAQFERVCLSAYLGYPVGTYLDPEQWFCTMAHANTLSLPGSLAKAGEALGIAEDQQKLKTGQALIRYFSTPSKTAGRQKNEPWDDWERWKLYVEYNAQDVVTELAIESAMKPYPVHPLEHRIYAMDQRMNDRGIQIDVDLAKSISAWNEQHNEQTMALAKELTGLSNPNSAAQLVEWFDQQGVPIESTRKEVLGDWIGKTGNSDVEQMIRYKLDLGKTSLKKYDKILEAVCSDGRIRGTLLYYGGNRTGRWAGRLLQVQNLPQTHLDDCELCRELIKDGDFESLELLHDDLPDTMKQLIRTAIVAPDGKTFVVCDYSAIEARLLAWLAQEEWRMDAFANGKDIYCESASQMFGVPVVKHGENGELRQKGKIAELACIAEGQRVLTDRGLIPIEEVTRDMRLWDGEEWVKHDGVVFRGEKEVIEWDGLVATPDHLVYVEGVYGPIQFGESARIGARYVLSGDGRRAIRVRKDYQSGKEMDPQRKARLESGLCSSSMPKLRRNQMGSARESDPREIKGLSALQPAIKASEMVESGLYSSQTEMHKPERRKLQKLWGERNRVLLCDGRRSVRLHVKNLRGPGSSEGARPDRCERTLRTRESEMGDSPRELPEPKKVYDILNAGPRHRFTVEGHLVHNCGYGGGVGALKAMGGEKEGLSEEEMQEIIDQWRDASPKIVKLWKSVEHCVDLATGGRLQTQLHPHNIRFYGRDDHLFIQLPSGRSLCYNGMHKVVKKRGSEFEFNGVDQQRKTWGKVKTWGGKLTENITQAIARDCLATALLRLEEAGYDVVFHVHDEVIIECDKETAEADYRVIQGIMGQPISWAPGLILTAEGFISDFYKKD